MPRLDELRNLKITRWIIYSFLGIIGILFIKSLISLYEDFEMGSSRDEMREYSNNLERKIFTENIYYNNIDSLLKLGQCDNAIRISKLRIKKHPEDKAFITRSIGYIYYCKGDMDSAIIKYTEAISLTSSYVSVYGDRGLVYMELDSLDLAIADFEFAANINYDYYLNLGLAQEEKGLIENAIHTYGEYLNHYPADLNYKHRRDSLIVAVKKGM